MGQSAGSGAHAEAAGASSAVHDGFRALYEAHGRSLLAYALRRVDRPGDAADVVAETFLVAWRRYDEVPEGTAGRLWLFGVARRVVANHRRGGLRRVRLADKLRQELQHQVMPDPQAGAGDAALVRAALARLDEDDRELLCLTTWEGMSPSELAELWSVPAATVRTRLHRARRRFRNEYEAIAGPVKRNGSHGHVGADERPLVSDIEERS